MRLVLSCYIKLIYLNLISLVAHRLRYTKMKGLFVCVTLLCVLAAAASASALVGEFYFSTFLTFRQPPPMAHFYLDNLLDRV